MAVRPNTLVQVFIIFYLHEYKVAPQLLLCIKYTYLFNLIYELMIYHFHN